MDHGMSSSFVRKICFTQTYREIDRDRDRERQRDRDRERQRQRQRQKEIKPKSHQQRKVGGAARFLWGYGLVSG